MGTRDCRAHATVRAAGDSRVHGPFDRL